MYFFIILQFSHLYLFYLKLFCQTEKNVNLSLQDNISNILRKNHSNRFVPIELMQLFQIKILIQNARTCRDCVL